MRNILKNTGHGKQPAQLSNVRVEYLPPNTTSHMQPMDQGIINLGKGNYKKRLVKKMLDGLDESEKIYYPNVKDALYMLVGDLLTDSDIVNIVKSMHTNIEKEEEKEEINEEKKITHKEAISSFDNLFKYLEDSEDFNDKDLNSLLNLKEKLDFIKSVKSVQTDLTNFVIKKD